MVQLGYTVQSFLDIAYAVDERAHERRYLDIYIPEGRDHCPVLMFVSGGGWTQGSKTWIGNIGHAMARKGLVVVTVDHRLIPESQYDGMVDDLALAFVWVKENIAAYNGNSNQVFVGGHSAGGYLMSLLGTDSVYLSNVGYTTDDIAGVVAMSVLFEINAGYLDSILEAVGSVDIQGHPLKRLADGDDKYASGSPMNHVRANLPPFLILYAERDLLGAYAEQAQLLAELLRAAQVSAELIEVKDRNHFTIVDKIGVSEDEVAHILYSWIASHVS